ncbi:MAG: response regulator [Leptospiraceae bacterium]|nr:response regulator [Leptospiraceae bacterium]
MEKILIIEDDELIRENMGELFSNEGYDVYSARNGRIGLERAKAIIPDMIISDIMMPEMDGFQVYKEMRENPQLSVIPFIFLSALSDKTNHRYGMSLGVDDYMTKPFVNSELLEVVKNRIKKSKLTKKSMEDLKLSLVNTVPHEFFTPLNAVLGFSQLLIDAAKEDCLSALEVLEFSEYIHAAGMNLLRLTRNYVLFSELTLKYNENSFVEMEVIYDAHLFLTDYIFEIAKSFGREKDLEIEFDVMNVKITNIYLKKILEELVDNAIKFSTANSKILINGYIGKDFYHVVVEDSGVGMTSSEIQQIESFTQFDRGKMEQAGMGLGLSIVRKILHISKGELVIKSEKGKGTKIIANIPLHDIRKS